MDDFSAPPLNTGGSEPHPFLTFFLLLYPSFLSGDLTPYPSLLLRSLPLITIFPLSLPTAGNTPLTLPLNTSKYVCVGPRCIVRPHLVFPRGLRWARRGDGFGEPLGVLGRL